MSVCSKNYAVCIRSHSKQLVEQGLKTRSSWPQFYALSILLHGLPGEGERESNQKT